MNFAIKLTRTHASSSQPIGRNLKAPAGIKFQHSQAKPHNMDEAEKSKPKTEHGDAGMTESFGDGYATRSNEEGFGGIYGGNEEEGVHGTTAEEKGYEKSQGSHVEEKEKARNEE
ncbi:Late embryogenesis abundant protein [Heracleum sosnowskyi]|uniref:Late embryogenesis abundant protein n=1 Tax=Heracleum sosnowskyi TaxID=360622 RepID=A0AAD8GZG5_9APIA|nr:Late embryogenesis abundant protein [Heracleum sosnowskyi]